MSAAPGMRKGDRTHATTIVEIAANGRSLSIRDQLAREERDARAEDVV
jgi:hypothetical protein